MVGPGEMYEPQCFPFSFVENNEMFCSIYKLIFCTFLLLREITHFVRPNYKWNKLYCYNEFFTLDNAYVRTKAIHQFYGATQTSIVVQ